MATGDGLFRRSPDTGPVKLLTFACSGRSVGHRRGLPSRPRSSRPAGSPTLPSRPRRGSFSHPPPGARL